MTVTNILREARKLSKQERLKLAEKLWNSVEGGWTDASLPEWQKDELDRRLRAHDNNPRAVTSWEAVEQKVAKRLRRGK